MGSDDMIRASDHDQENAAELLREAYAVGRLSHKELDERAAAAYSARTLGELHDLTADLPFQAARTGLPSDIVAPPLAPRRAGRHRLGQLIWIFALIAVAGVAGLMSPAAGWVAAALIPVVLLALATSRRLAEQDGQAPV
jgi:hypothetical protein